MKLKCNRGFTCCIKPVFWPFGQTKKKKLLSFNWLSQNEVRAVNIKLRLIHFPAVSLHHQLIMDSHLEIKFLWLTAHCTLHYFFIYSLFNVQCHLCNVTNTSKGYWGKKCFLDCPFTTSWELLHTVKNRMCFLPKHFSGITLGLSFNTHFLWIGVLLQNAFYKTLDWFLWKGWSISKGAEPINKICVNLHTKASDSSHSLSPFPYWLHTGTSSELLSEWLLCRAPQ